MKYNYVKTCSCCGTQFSRFNTPLIDVAHKEELKGLMEERVEELEMRGNFELLCNDEYVSAFYYEYANAAEEMYSNDLCDSLYEIACDFYEGKLTEINDWVFEEEFV
ncbi:hypothetical protein G6728_07160 [Polynucleobacter paneuropaeus]|jgi:hypothetical protein|nr:hypothetical protein G6728_07160 [Polynucleobacter paneuropaeus]